MDNVSKEIEELNTATEIKNAFDGLITRLNIAEKTISEPKNKSTETFKTEKNKRTKLKKIYIYNILYISSTVLYIRSTILYIKPVGQLQLVYLTHNRNTSRRKRERNI